MARRSLKRNATIDPSVASAPVASKATRTVAESGTEAKETLTFLDDDIARFMDEAVARRGTATATTIRADWDRAGYYERAFRVLGRYMDEQKPRDVFFFEQDGAFVVRLLMADHRGSRHVLAEFTREDIDGLVTGGPNLRTAASTPGAKPGAKR